MLKHSENTMAVNPKTLDLSAFSEFSVDKLLKNHGIEMADRSDAVHERRSAKLGRLAQLDSTCPRTGLLARGFVARFGDLTLRGAT